MQPVVYIQQVCKHACKHACTQVHACTDASIRPSVHPSIHPSIHPSMNTCNYMSMHTYVNEYIHAYMFAFWLAGWLPSFTCRHACVHVCACTHVYKCAKSPTFVCIYGRLGSIYAHMCIHVGIPLLIGSQLCIGLPAHLSLHVPQTSCLSSTGKSGKCPMNACN